LATAVVIAVAAIGIFAVEGGQNEHIKTVYDAL
jgi:hypothetical protein